MRVFSLSIPSSNLWYCVKFSEILGHSERGFFNSLMCENLVSSHKFKNNDYLMIIFRVFLEKNRIEMRLGGGERGRGGRRKKKRGVRFPVSFEGWLEVCRTPWTLVMNLNMACHSEAQLPQRSKRPKIPRYQREILARFCQFPLTINCYANYEFSIMPWIPINH